MKSHRLFCTVGAILLTWMALIGPVRAQTVWYVDGVNGNDVTASGVLAFDAFQTINRAVAVASSGDTINVLPATYQEAVVITQSGIRLEALPTATMQPLPGQPCIEIDATNNDILSDTVVRGFLFDASITSGRGIYAHNDLNGNTPFEISPTIEMNQFQDCSQAITLDVIGSGGTSEAIIRYNEIDYDLACSAPFSLGITVNVNAGAFCGVHIRSNWIKHQEWGIGIFEDFQSLTDILIECDFLGCNEWGILAQGNVNARITNETVAFGSPASTTGIVYGIFVNSPGVSVDNTIVWVPDGFDCNGEAFTGDDLFGPVTLDAFSMIQDNGAPNPQFVNPAIHDYHLLSTSPAIDAGNTGLVSTTGTQPIDYDFDGAPRIMDPTRTGNLAVDVGAHEFTTVGMNVFDPADAANSTGRPYVSARLGGQVSVQVTGFVGDNWYFWWDTNDSYGFNSLISNIGNQLVPVVFPAIITPMTSTSMTVTFNMPPATSIFLQELEFHLQSLMLVPGSNPFVGGFARRVVVELNQ